MRSVQGFSRVLAQGWLPCLPFSLSLYVCGLLFPAGAAIPAELGVVVEAPTLEELKGCARVKLRAPSGVTIPSFLAPRIEWEEGFSRAQRSYGLLDLEPAGREVKKLLKELREAGFWGGLRLKAEKLAAELFLLSGENREAEEAIHALALMHLFQEPDPALFSPDLRSKIILARNTLFSQGVTRVRLSPPPRALYLHGVSLPVTFPVEVPSFSGLAWEFFYDRAGWLRYEGLPPHEEWEPLLDPFFLKNLFPQGIPPYLLTAGKEGVGLYTFPDRNLISFDPHSPCAVFEERGAPLAEAPKPTPPSPPLPLYRKPWFYGVVGGAAVLSGVGVYFLLQGDRSRKTGTIVITW